MVHERAVGIDVERVRDCQTSTPARVTLLRQRKCTRSRRFHTRQDDGFLYVLDTHGRLRQAIGTGSNRPLDGFVVAFLPGEPARLRWVANDSCEKMRWSFEALSPAPDSVAVVAVEGGRPGVRF